MLVNQSKASRVAIVRNAILAEIGEENQRVLCIDDEQKLKYLRDPQDQVSPVDTK